MFVTYKEQILKSSLLKHIPIEVINNYESKQHKELNHPISVYDSDGNYYVLDGIDSLLSYNGMGEQLIECFVTHKDSFL